MSPEFNLGPLHLLNDVAQQMYDLKYREYIYRKTQGGLFKTRPSRLADAEEGSAVKSRRETEVNKAHLPVEMWKKMPVPD